MNTSPLNEKLSLRPDQERRQGQADAALPHLPEWNEYLLRLVEKGKSPADYYLRCPLTPFNGTQSLPIFRKKVLSTEGASGGSAEIAYPSYPRWSTVAIERKEEFDCLEKVFFLVDGF